MAEQVVKSIRVQHLHAAAFHHRTCWGALAELRDSIADMGIIEPLVVRARKDGGYEVICGMRRLKAGVMADLKTVPCLVLELDDADAIAMQVAENLEREGLHPIDEAMYFDDLHRGGMDHAAIAKRLQVKKRHVIQRMKLLALSAAARKAFINDKFGEDEALALARLADAGKQGDVLAALDAGSIQREEIVGYVAREFTASLEDVPWRVSDEMLVQAAGPCTTCHKRSDVQKDLFGADQKALRCLDVACWRSKMDATFAVEAAKEGASLIDESAHNLFVPQPGRPVVMKSTGYVDADASCQFMIGHTWRQAVGKSIKADAEPPTLYLARDQDGRPRFLLRESVVGKMVRKSDAAKELAAQQAEADPVKNETSPAAGPSPRAEGKIRRAIVAGFVEAVIANQYDTWGWVAERVIDNATPRAISSAASLFEKDITALGVAGLEADKIGLLELIRQSNRQAKRVSTAVLIFDEADVVGEIQPSVRALADACDIDLVALERDIRKAP